MKLVLSILISALVYGFVILEYSSMSFEILKNGIQGRSADRFGDTITVMICVIFLLTSVLCLNKRKFRNLYIVNLITLIAFAISFFLDNKIKIPLITMTSYFGVIGLTFLTFKKALLRKLPFVIALFFTVAVNAQIDSTINCKILRVEKSISDFVYLIDSTYSEESKTVFLTYLWQTDSSSFRIGDSLSVVCSFNRPTGGLILNGDTLTLRNCRGDNSITVYQTIDRANKKKESKKPDNERFKTKYLYYRIEKINTVANKG